MEDTSLTLVHTPQRCQMASIAMLCNQAVYDSKLITDEIVEEFYQMATLPGAAEATLVVRSLNTLLGFG
jgi:hypothetical protein